MGQMFYFPSEGRHAEDFYIRKNPRTRVSEASMLTTRPPKPSSTTVTVGRTMILQYHITLHHIIGKGSFTFLSLGTVRMKTICLCC